MPHVCIIDSHPDDAQHVRWMLANSRAEHFEITTLAAPPADPTTLRDEGIELLLLSLTDEHGIATLDGLRAALPEIPVVILGSDDEASLGRLTLQHGAQDYLVKSQLHPDSLCRSLRHAFERGRISQTREPAQLVQTVTGILDRLPMGVIFLDQELRVVLTNAQARTLLNASSVLRIGKDGHLRIADARESRELGRIIYAVLKGGGRTEEHLECAVVIGRDSGDRPLSLLVTAVGNDAPGAVLFVTDPHSPVEISGEVLGTLYGLTPAEAKLVVELSRGHTLETIAENGHVSPHTLRTQLKQVFRKTGTARQSELVKLTLTGPAVLNGRGTSG